MSENALPVRYDSMEPIPSSNHGFAELTARHIFNRLPEFIGARMCIRSYLAPDNDTDDASSGYMEIALAAEPSKEVRLGIAFGRRDADGYPWLREFDHSEWIANDRDPVKCAIFAFDFDGAWRVVCLVGVLMKVQSVTMAYGGAGSS